MKINKNVSDLARKLDYLNYLIKKRRSIIKLCMFPLLHKINYLEKQINEGYLCTKILNEVIDETNKRLKQNELLLYAIDKVNKKTEYDYSKN